MKKRISKTNQVLRYFAAAILLLITVALYLSNPGTALGLTTAMALTIGGFTLEGKDEAIFAGMKAENDKVWEKLEKDYISANKANEMIMSNINAALKEAGIDKIKEFDALQQKYEECNKALTEQGLYITEIKAKVKDEVNKNIYLQVKDFLSANPEKINDWVNKKAPFTLELKDSPIQMLTTNVSGLAGVISRYVDPTIARPALPASLMLSYGRVFTTDSAQILYSDWSAVQNAALTPITEGSAKTQQSATLTVSTSSYKELGSFIKVSDRMLRDISFIASEIQQLIENYLVNSIETNLLTLTSWGLIAASGHLATHHTDTSLNGTIPSPGVLDAIIACIVQIMKENFYPNLIVLNPTDYGLLLTKKTSTFEYTFDGLNYVVSINGGGVAINGIPVAISNRLTAGDVLVGDFTKANIGLYGGLNIEWGYDANDFTLNQRTIKAYQNIHLYVKTNEKPAFVWDAISTITGNLSNGS